MVQKCFDICVKPSLGSDHCKQVFHLYGLVGRAKPIPTHGQDIQYLSLIPTKCAGHLSCRPNLETPRNAL